MQKRKGKNKLLLIIGIVYYVSGLLLLAYVISIPILNSKKESDALSNFYIQEEKKNDTNQVQNNKENQMTRSLEYIAVLKIPKIKLEKGLVAKDSKYNNIDYGIKILKESDSPDVINGNVILASHSGTADISYFNNLDKLKINDEVLILYNGKTYQYKIVNIYDIDKTGKAKINRNNNKSTITLITCRNGTNKQIVLIGELQNL